MNPHVHLAKYFLVYLTAALVFCLLDFVWLAFLAKDFYQSQLGNLMLAQPRQVPAAAFYILYLFGLLVFAIVPALRQRHWETAMFLSALLGLIAYATYDLSNLATLKGWPVSLALIDIAWGTFASAVAGTAGYFVGIFINER